MSYKGKSKTSKYLKRNPKALAKKRKYDKEYRRKEVGSASPDSPKKRQHIADSNARWKERKKRGIAGKGGKDVSHRADGKLVLENRTKNRARNGRNGKSTKKPVSRRRK